MGQLIADAVSHLPIDAINRGPMLNESPPGCVYARQRVCGVSRVIRLLATTLQESTLVSRVVVAVVPNAASRRESSRRRRRTRRRALCPGHARSHSE